MIFLFFFHYCPDTKKNFEHKPQAPGTPIFKAVCPGGCSTPSTLPASCWSKHSGLCHSQADKNHRQTTLGCSSLTALLGTGQPRPAGRLRSSQGLPRRLGMPPLGRDFHQLQSETRTSCLTCYNHYESYTDCQGTGELLQGPPALLPGQSFPSAVRSRVLSGWWWGEESQNCRQATPTIRCDASSLVMLWVIHSS